MAYTAWSVVFGEQPTAAKWNQLGTNDAGFKDGTNIDNDAILTRHILDDNVTPDKIAWAADNVRITGIYNAFYTRPNYTSSVGTSTNSTGIPLPRTVAAGESVFIFPIGMRWCVVEFVSNTTTTFDFTSHCVVASSVISSKWTAIYYRTT